VGICAEKQKDGVNSGLSRRHCRTLSMSQACPFNDDLIARLLSSSPTSHQLLPNSPTLTWPFPISKLQKQNVNRRWDRLPTEPCGTSAEVMSVQFLDFKTAGDPI
jgi:hypothetical protein